MRRFLIVALFLVISIFGLSNITYGCALSCAAICRYVCEGTPQSETGCGDTAYASSLQRCCEAAYDASPELKTAPCLVSPPQS